MYPSVPSELARRRAEFYDDLARIRVRREVENGAASWDDLGVLRGRHEEWLRLARTVEEAPPPWAEFEAELSRPPGAEPEPEPEPEAEPGSWTITAEEGGSPFHDVLTAEAIEAAKVWAENASRSAWKVWNLYRRRARARKPAPDPDTLLGRVMVEHLVTALDEGGLVWDERRKALDFPAHLAAHFAAHLAAHLPADGTRMIVPRKRPS